MELLETIKSITETHIAALKRTRYQPVHMGARDWAQPGPVFITREGWVTPPHKLRQSSKPSPLGQQ